MEDICIYRRHTSADLHNDSANNFVRVSSQAGYVWNAPRISISECWLRMTSCIRKRTPMEFVEVVIRIELKINPALKDPGIARDLLLTSLRALYCFILSSLTFKVQVTLSL